MRWIFLILIKSYQWLVSPLLGGNCRFYPTCSDYAKEALEVHGVIRGGWLVMRRVGKCHPFGGHGVDPVPEQMHYEEKR